MRPTDVVIRSEAGRALVGSADTLLAQALGNSFGTLLPGSTLAGASSMHSRMVGVDVQTNNMYPLPLPESRKFDAANQTQSGAFGSGQRRIGGRCVVVGNGEQSHAGGACPIQQVVRTQAAVRRICMGV